MEFAKLWLVCLAVVQTAPPALAFDRADVVAVQLALEKHGYNVGDPDGRIGPATSRALEDFAKDNQVSSDLDAVLLEMSRRSISARSYVSDEVFLEQVETKVSALLRDPESVMIRYVFRVRDADTDIICGEVNGRNALGGYAGFTSFYGVLVGSTFLPLSIDTSDAPVATLVCMLAFPKF